MPYLQDCPESSAKSQVLVTWGDHRKLHGEGLLCTKQAVCAFAGPCAFRCWAFGGAKPPAQPCISSFYSNMGLGGCVLPPLANLSLSREGLGKSGGSRHCLSPQGRAGGGTVPSILTAWCGDSFPERKCFQGVKWQ